MRVGGGRGRLGEKRITVRREDDNEERGDDERKIKNDERRE